MLFTVDYFPALAKRLQKNGLTPIMRHLYFTIDSIMQRPNFQAFFSSLRPRLRNSFYATLRGLIRLYFRPGWIEHGQHERLLPGGVYIANFASWADSFLLAVLFEKEFRHTESEFAIAINIRHKNLLFCKLVNRLANVLYFDPVKKDAPCNALLRDVIASGGTVILQPEGRPTDTGTIQPICQTLAAILAETAPTLHPLYIEGMMESVFSAVKPRQLPTRFRPRITLHLFPPSHLTIAMSANTALIQTRQAARQIFDLLVTIAFHHQDYHRTLFSAVIDASKHFGGRHIVSEDVERKTLRYRQLLIGSFALGSAIRAQIDRDEKTVGMMLPNVNGALTAFYALQLQGLTVALLNFTAGRAAICSSAKTANIKTVITSRRFVQISELEATINALGLQGIRILYLEDLRDKLGLGDKLTAAAKSLFPHYFHIRQHRDKSKALGGDHTAVILFTSGSEGAPKGVALSHANLIANVFQIRAQLDIGLNDCIFNPLPQFHTSGLMGGYILPLLSGMKVFLYPSPLHYQTIPELIADSRATVLFVTDTFLNGYARHAHTHDLYRLRYVFAGAEKLREETRRIWAEQFGVRVLEGYGVTETSPTLAFNTPIFCKPGTVGRLIPGIDYRLEPVEGIMEGGKLLVSGPNIMSGYLLPEKPGEIQPLHDTWHDTGDIVSLDEEGFVTIIGRAKRFAKIGGEMVSLAAVETHLAHLWPEGAHAVIARPDKRKGEQLILLTTQTDATREAIVAFFREQGITELSLPRQVLITSALPLLGSGKTDYPAVLEYVDKSS